MVWRNLLLLYLKMEAAGFPERYPAAHCYIPEDSPNKKFALH